MRSATRKKTGRDPAYLKWIRTLPCVCCCFESYRSGLIWEMLGTVMLVGIPVTEAAHVGGRGLSQKCNDRETIPLCRWHHRTGPESHHRAAKRFWEFWAIDKTELIRKLNENFEEEHAEKKSIG